MENIRGKVQLILSIVLLVGLTAFGYMKVTKFIDLYEYKAALEDKITELDTEVGTLTGALSEAKTLNKEVNDAKDEEIGSIFPTEEDLTSLNRAFDEFESENNFSNSPFFISNISYKDSVESEDALYTVLSFTMQIDSSEDNFYKFLEYIETSGNLDTGVRLMEITDISINLASSGDEGLISYSLELNAYFQK